MKGYDNIPAFFQTVLDIPMFEGGGALAHDISRLAALDKTMTLTGPPAWTQVALSNTNILSFNPATPDYLLATAANTTDMNYLAGDFSGMAWVNASLLVGAARSIFSRGLLNTDGWYFNVLATGELSFDTNQGAANQVSTSAAGTVVINTWCLLGFTRSGASVKLFKNGVDVTSVSGAHTDPLTSARDLHIGVDDAHAAPWSGYIWRPRVWSRQIGADEMAAIFSMERGLLGV